MTELVCCIRSDTYAREDRVRGCCRPGRATVDQVRRTENRQLHSQGSDLLSGTKYVWLKNPDNWHETDHSKFERSAFLWMQGRQGLAAEGTFQRILELF